MSYHPNAWEFDVVQFIRDEFELVGLALPSFNGNDHLWQCIYAIAFGANEIAHFYRDQVELSFRVDGDQLQFQYRTKRTDTFTYYSQLTQDVINGEMERVLSKELLPTHGDGLPVDHKTNLRIIEELMKGEGYREDEFVDDMGEPLDVQEGMLDDFGDFQGDLPSHFDFNDVPPGIAIGRLI
jgi:hypothetical protein